MAVAVMRGTAPESALQLALKTSAGGWVCRAGGWVGGWATSLGCVNRRARWLGGWREWTEHDEQFGCLLARRRARARSGSQPAPLYHSPPADLNTPMAPELGLFLDEAYFDGYNKQVRGAGSR